MYSHGIKIITFETIRTKAEHRLYSEEYSESKYHLLLLFLLLRSYHLTRTGVQIVRAGEEFVMMVIGNTRATLLHYYSEGREDQAFIDRLRESIDVDRLRTQKDSRSDAVCHSHLSDIEWRNDVVKEL